MAGYEKFTLKSFQEKLTGGGYDSLKGVNRAIGRMSTWSEKDREKARALAQAHFGDAPAPKAKAAKKQSKAGAEGAKKTPAKKVTKKTTAKASSKKTSKTKKTTTKAPKAPKQPRAAVAAPKAPRTTSDPVDQANRRVGTIRSTLESMELAKRLGAPNEEVAEGAKRAQSALTRVIDELGASVSSLMGGAGISDAEARGAKAFETAARATQAAGGNGIQPGPTATTGAPPLPQVATPPEG